MLRKTKPLCLTVLALMAFGGLSTAQASEIHSEDTHTHLSGLGHAGEDTWGFEAGFVTCPETSYVGGTMSSATVQWFELTPFFKECKAFGFVKAEIDREGCAYRFHTENGTENNEGNMSIACPVGNLMKITSFSCEVTIPPQGGLKKVTYTNRNSGTVKERDITIDLNVTGISYTQHPKGFPECKGGAFKNGTLNGSITMRGFSTPGPQIGIWNH